VVPSLGVERTAWIQDSTSRPRCLRWGAMDADVRSGSPRVPGWESAQHLSDIAYNALVAAQCNDRVRCARFGRWFLLALYDHLWPPERDPVLVRQRRHRLISGLPSDDELVRLERELLRQARVLVRATVDQGFIAVPLAETLYVLSHRYRLLLSAGDGEASTAAREHAAPVNVRANRQ